MRSLVTPDLSEMQLLKHVDEGSAERKRKRLRLDKTFSLTFSLKRDAKITVDDNPYLKKTVVLHCV